MADLRSRFIEDYAGGLLNVSRQELASNGEVLSQDGFLTDATIFVEDGVGTKSGLKLGVGLAESVDPTTQTGLVNVRYADRTYTKIRDTKIFATAIASAQAALAESVSESLTNVESAIDFIEIFNNQANNRISGLETGYSQLSEGLSAQSLVINNLRDSILDEIAGLKLGTDPDTNNIRIGVGALDKLQNGASNTAIGFYSLGELFSGSDNIAIGTQAGIELLEGNNNILIGNGARLSSPKVNDQIVLGSPKNDYLWCKTDIYTPAVTLSANDSSASSITTSSFFKFVQSLEFRRINWEKGQSYVVIEPTSLKRAEESLGFKGYLHSESKSVANAKLVPLMMQTLSGLFDILGITFSAGADAGSGLEGDTPIFDGSGNPILDSNGNPIVIGGPIFDENGDPINGDPPIGEPIFDADGNEIIAAYNPNEPSQGNAINYNFVPDGTGNLTVLNAEGRSIDQILEQEDPLEKFKRNFVPLGSILMWSNYQGKPVPDGWSLCDGTNDTPDLRDKFIIAAGGSFNVGDKKDEPPEVPLHKHEAEAKVEWTETIAKVVGPLSDTEPLVPDPFKDYVLEVPSTVPPATDLLPAISRIGGALSGVPEELGEGLTRCTVSTYQTECPSDNQLERSEDVDITIEETGEEPPKTFPPYYALAFIMRIY